MKIFPLLFVMITALDPVGMSVAHGAACNADDWMEYKGIGNAERSLPLCRFSGK
jgi:hypothetical protein